MQDSKILKKNYPQNFELQNIKYPPYMQYYLIAHRNIIIGGEEDQTVTYV